MTKPPLSTDVAIEPALLTGALSRRQVLSRLGAAGAAALVGTGAAPGQNPPAALVATHHSPMGCVVTPSQTEGPYFVDERLERTDVRIDPTDGTVCEGMPLELQFAVSRVDGTTCSPVTGAVVDLWQCDALGVYSDVRDFQGLFDTTGKKFLRGHQITGTRGIANFLTVYPGWYAGRSVHIHFKVRVLEGTRRVHEFTSQIYFDENTTDAVHATAPYNTKARRDTMNDRDRTYLRESSGTHLLVPLRKTSTGYAGDFAVGLRFA